MLLIFLFPDLYHIAPGSIILITTSINYSPTVECIFRSIACSHRNATRLPHLYSILILIAFLSNRPRIGSFIVFRCHSISTHPRLYRLLGPPLAALFSFCRLGRVISHYQKKKRKTSSVSTNLPPSSLPQPTTMSHNTLLRNLSRLPSKVSLLLSPISLTSLIIASFSTSPRLLTPFIQTIPPIY